LEKKLYEIDVEKIGTHGTGNFDFEAFFKGGLGIFLEDFPVQIVVGVFVKIVGVKNDVCGGLSYQSSTIWFALPAASATSSEDISSFRRLGFSGSRIGASFGRTTHAFNEW
jgi:hypothetical protein